MNIKEKVIEYRDVIIIVLISIFGSFIMVSLDNIETGARSSIDSANARFGHDKCRSISKLISDSNMTKGVTVDAEELNMTRAACSNYLKYLGTTPNEVPNITEEIQQTEKTLKYIDKALNGH